MIFHSALQLANSGAIATKLGYRRINTSNLKRAIMGVELYLALTRHMTGYVVQSIFPARMSPI